MDDIPTFAAAETKTTIKNKKTGVIYKDHQEWKDQGIDIDDIQTDIVVKMPRLDLYGKTK